MKTILNVEFYSKKNRVLDLNLLRGKFFRHLNLLQPVFIDSNIND